MTTRSLSSLLTKKQDIKMIQNNDNKQDTSKHIHSICPVGDVISSVCTCKNAELEKDSLVPVYCLNCNAYVQTDL